MRMGILKKAIKAFLYPKGVFLAVLSVCAVAFLVYTLSCKAPGEPISIVSYVLSAYSLTVFCLKTPQIFRSLNLLRKIINLSGAGLIMCISGQRLCCVLRLQQIRLMLFSNLYSAFGIGRYGSVCCPVITYSLL